MIADYTPIGNKRCIKFCKEHNGCHPDICPQNRGSGCKMKSRTIFLRGLIEMYKDAKIEMQKERNKK
jgi:hypothetical protein